ncbi:MAG: alpha/beta hydrolase [Pseudomonadales bacterium]|nr:alpha/beta hydrolase [Pseudomonadales bacterium]
MEFIQVENGDVSLNVAVKGTGPVILCVHGWPELWYSWRHQIEYFSARGFRVAAMDVRGYGRSTIPDAISDYSMRKTCSDVKAVAKALSPEPVILMGHDWGAPIVWQTTLWHPEQVRAVAGLSVPYFPIAEGAFVEQMKFVYQDRFFYQIYFQAEGIAEAEIEADLPSALRKIYFSLSGDAPLNDWLKDKPADSGLLTGMIDPQPFPAWLSEDDLQVYIDAFTAGRFRGPINRYRAQGIDAEESGPIRGRQIEQPACFIAGSKDICRNIVPGMDLYQNVAGGCNDFRGSTIIDGVGHWVQQEAPEATNLALAEFVDGLS